MLVALDEGAGDLLELAESKVGAGKSTSDWRGLGTPMAD